MPGPFDLLKIFAEIFAVLGIIAFFFLHRAIRRFPAAGRRRIVFLTLLIVFGAEGIAQLTTRNQFRYPQLREPFPLTRWAMFGGMTDCVETALVHDYRGLRAGGSSVSLNPAQLFVTPNTTVHFTKTQALASAIRSQNPADVAYGTAAADAYARGLMNRYNACHLDSPISSVELWERKIRMQPGARVPVPFTGPDCQIVYTFHGD
jgi:hypothetical protein